MPVEQFATLYQSSVATAIASGDTSLNLTTTAGLPASPAQFRLRFEPAGGSTSTFEIVLCQVVDATHVQSISPTTGSVSTAGRGIEGTTAQAWIVGSLATQVITAGGLVNTGQSGTFPQITPGGLTGATAAARWVGATTGGPPTSGTFAVGDYVITQTGQIFICTVAGTQGTWVGSGMKSAAVLTGENGSSTSYADLTTTGPAVTLVTGAQVKVSIYAELSNDTGNNETFMSFAVSGATTVAATDTMAISYLSYATGAGFHAKLGASFPVTGLNIGSNTFTAKYRVSGHGGTYYNRRIMVEPA